MKKYCYLLLAAFSAGMILSSCEPGTGVEPDPVGQTYKRVQLIEHFTGAECGYCPMGMDYIYEEYSKDPDNMVWVSNHYGFGSDEYSIKGSTTIGKKLKVTGAPSISINRYKYTNSSEGIKNEINYHPYFTSAVLKKQETTATSCVELERTYDAATRMLHVKATMKTTDEAVAGFMLTLGVTESGMLGVQADYNGSWEGWKEFTHTHTIRVYATAALGDTITLKKRTAVAEYDIELDEKWVADNCEIVAWITEIDTYYPVLNAAKLPVVEDTKGGEDIKHGGVTMVPVPDTYPENGAPASNISFKEKSVTPKTGYVVLELQSDTVIGRNNYGNLFPYIVLYMGANADTIAYGTYTVSSELTPTSVYAGYRDDEKFETGGSCLYYCFTYNGKIYLGNQWYVAAGSITVAAEGVTIDITTKNGNAFHATYAGDINATAAAAPQKAPMQIKPLYMMMAEGEPKAKLLYF